MADGNVGRELDRADAEIDAFIEKRHREREQANAEAAAEREQVRSYLSQRNGGHSQEWAAFYRSQIEAAEDMRERAVERLGKLIDGGAD